jgi:hypothetical protein
MDYALEGKIIELINMPDDPNPIEPGTEGTIKYQDDMGHIHVDWDNGRSLSVIPGVDRYVIKEGKIINSKKIVKITESQLKMLIENLLKEEKPTMSLPIILKEKFTTPTPDIGNFLYNMSQIWEDFDEGEIEDSEALIRIQEEYYELTSNM